MQISVHHSRLQHLAISRNETDLPVDIVNDDGKKVDDGWYIMRGSRDYKSIPRHYNDRRRKGEYWYQLAEKGGARFARQFTKHGCMTFRLPNRFFEKMSQDVCVLYGSAKRAVESSFRLGFFAELRKLNPIYENRIWAKEHKIDVHCLPLHLYSEDFSLVAIDDDRKGWEPIAELMSELSKIDRLLLQQNNKK